MCPPPDEVDMVQVFKLLVWAIVEHLVEAVGEIKCLTTIDLIVRFPVGRRDHLFNSNSFFDIGNANPF